MPQRFRQILARPSSPELPRSEPLGDPKSDGHRWIEMCTGDVAEGDRENRDGESGSKRSAENASARSLQEALGANRACAEKNQCESAEKFSNKFLRGVVHRHLHGNDGSKR